MANGELVVPAPINTGTITLNVYRSRIAGKDLPVSKWMRGFGDGRIFPSYDAAFQFAFDHGYTMLYFTEPDLRAKRKRSGRRSHLAV